MRTFTDPRTADARANATFLMNAAADALARQESHVVLALMDPDWEEGDEAVVFKNLTSAVYGDVVRVTHTPQGTHLLARFDAATILETATMVARDLGDLSQ